MSKLTEILDQTLQDNYEGGAWYINDKFYAEAEQAINAYIAEIIGPDKEQTLPGLASEDDGESHDRFYRIGGYILLNRKYTDEPA